MSKLAAAISSVLAARSMGDLLQSYDQLFLFGAPVRKVEFGVSKRDGVSIERERKEANSRAMAILARVGTDHTLLTEDDKDELRRYSGLGGIGGSIHEYYTPQWVAEGVWDMMGAMGAGPGNYLEPSAGAGVFHGTKPKGMVMTATEIDETSSQINQLLHPEDRVVNGAFETLAVSAEDNSWDGVVGNVPFGETRGSYGALDPEYADVKYVDQYFVDRMLDKIKPGALACVVVPMRIVSGSKFKAWRRKISLKGEFLGAHRLPSGTFSNNGTDTATDILVMRKHPEGLAELINGRKKADLEGSNVLWGTFINGKWFETAEGRRFIHGEQSTSGQGKFARTVVDKGTLTSASIKKRLAHRFESRIDWLALEVAEPVTPTYGEGDERLINGRWCQLVNGQWQTISRVGSDGDSISKEEYGVGSMSQLQTMLAQSPLNALELSYAQLMAVHRDFPRLTEGPVADAIKMANTLEPKHRERVIRGSIIGLRIHDMLEVVNQTNEIPPETAAELRNLVNNEIQIYGIAAADRKLAALSGGYMAGSWNAFVKATDVNGKFSDLLQGTLERGKVRAFDETNAAEVVAYLFGQVELVPVDLSDFLDAYKGSEGTTLEDLAKVPGIAITPDGMMMPMDRATSGDVAKKRQRLQAAMTEGTDPAILSNYQAQLDGMEARRKRTKVDDIEMTMVGKWLPRRYVAEFLEAQGYSDLVYSKIVENDDGELVEDTEYQGEGGVWSGYTMRGGKKRTSANEQFERQLENYLNGLPVRSGDAAGAAAYRQRIQGIEQQFAVWLRQHDDIEQLSDLYNDTFNGYVPFDHSDAPLELEGISGRMVPFGYQCSAVRRLSEDGRGVLAFGTGLGKTATALSLVAYNTQTGRSRRTGIVVPLSMIENWYHEAKTFYNEQAFSKILFAGLEPVRSKSGEIEQEAMLDDEGNPRLGANGEELTHDKLRILSGKAVTERLNSIPQSNYTLVVMTKEQYASIPMRPDTIVAHADTMKDAGLRAGKFEADAKGHREAMKKEKFAEKHSNTGTAKKLDIPYFEDMGFDSVVVDEAHNYRNSYQAGREAGQLAYLPTQASAKMAIDMAVKSAYLRKTYNGRGPVLLTATPTVNSPIDIFNMLSHILSIEEWQELGITDVDDFVRVFGETENVLVHKLSGEIETKQGLVGFKNLSGLRSLFHRWVNLKDAKDVSDTVKIPPLEEILSEAEMTSEQATIYEELRQRADALSKGSGNQDPDAPKDSIFSIIRDMDRVCTDADLYHRQMTFRFPVSNADAVAKLVADLPATLNVELRDDDKTDEDAEKVKRVTEHGAKVSKDEHCVTLVVTEAYENEVVNRLEKFGISSKDVGHPVTPKYARMLENLRAGAEQGGKQIIFTEEKSQHAKLKRIICNHLGIEPDQIGIINASTVSGKAADDELKGLEAIAAAYNDGRFRILICNKKAEVGVNLHMGTTDIHHLTLPWTPASIKQRNGRGARVGAKQSKVRVHYYAGKGSFDSFRLETLKRKAAWQNELFTSDAERMKNADADDAMEASLLLAQDPEERQARLEENMRKAAEKVRKAAAQRANIDLHNYLKAAHDMAGGTESIEQAANTLRARITETEQKIEDAKKMAAFHRETAKSDPYSPGYWRKKAKEQDGLVSSYTKTMLEYRKELITTQRRIERTGKAAQSMKRLRPEVERAIKDGLIKADIGVLDNGEKYLTDGNKTVQVGKRYMSAIGRTVIEVVAVFFDGKNAKVRYVTSTVKDSAKLLDQEVFWPLSSFGEECSYTQSEIDLLRTLSSKQKVGGIADLLDAGQFASYIQDGTLELDTDSYLLHKDGEFETAAHYSYSGPMDIEKRKRIVYPDPKDEALKAKLAKWLMADRNRLSNAKDFTTALYGKDLVVAVEAYGEQAPAQVINEWLSATIADYRETERAITSKQSSLESTDMFSFYFVGYAKNNIPAQWSNVSAFTAAIKEGEKILATEIGELKKAETLRRDAVLAAKFNAAKAQPASSRIERLKWLQTESRTPAASGNGFSWAGNLRRNGSVPSFYKDGDKTDITLILSDLLAAGIGKEPTDETAEGFAFAFDSAIYAMKADGRYGGKSTLQEWLTRQEAPEPEQEPEAVDTDASSEADKLVAATEPGAAPEVDGLVFRVNTAPFQVGGGKYRSGGGWRSRAATSYGAGEVMGIHDPKGKDGVLYDRKEQLKAAIGRDAVKFSSDASGEFPGAWWFVPASTSHETLINILGGE